MPSPQPAANAARSESKRTGPLGRAIDYFRHRVDPLTSLFLVVPLFVIYQLGVLSQMRCSHGACAWEGNGVDFLTGTLFAATHGSLIAFASITVGVAIALAVAILWARRRSRLHPRLFAPVILESAMYASLVGPAVVYVQHAVGLGVQANRTLLGDVIASCGAGLHEELVFRAGLFAGGAFLLRRIGLRPLFAMGIAALVSAVLFSLVHHLGALGEPFTVSAFVFRILAGLTFTVVYRVRGFAIAAWTHALYDIWVFGMQHV